MRSSEDVPARAAPPVPVRPHACAPRAIHQAWTSRSSVRGPTRVRINRRYCSGRTCDNQRMSRRLCTAALILAFAVDVSAQFSRYEPEWNKPATPHKVIGDIYFVGTTELATFLITSRSGHILLDPGFEESVPLIKNAMRTLGFKYEDIRVLLNSQAHFDHA